jgi:hypothetical protein
MDINTTVDNLLDLIKIHSFEESVPGFILNLKTLIMFEEDKRIPTTTLMTSGYHTIFGITALASPYIPQNVIGIMALQKVETLRRLIHHQKGASQEFVDGITKVMVPGLFLYNDEQYLMLEILEEKITSE